jgi:hypothetical protein
MLKAVSFVADRPTMTEVSRWWRTEPNKRDSKMSSENLARCIGTVDGLIFLLREIPSGTIAQPFVERAIRVLERLKQELTQ